MTGMTGGPTSVPKQDEVRLAVPATPEFLRLARVTAAGLASRLGFTFDEVDDLRLAIDELCFALIGAAGRTGTVELRYRLQDEGLEVFGTGHFEGNDLNKAELTDLSELILDALVDEHELASGTGGPTFRLVKRRNAVE
jgi:hypothetical protein